MYICTTNSRILNNKIRAPVHTNMYKHSLKVRNMDIQNKQTEVIKSNTYKYVKHSKVLNKVIDNK